MNHRKPWDERDEQTLYRCVGAGMMQEQVAERLGRTKRAIRWKVGIDRASAAVVAGKPKGCRALSNPPSGQPPETSGDVGTPSQREGS